MTLSRAFELLEIYAEQATDLADASLIVAAAGIGRAVPERTRRTSSVS